MNTSKKIRAIAALGTLSGAVWAGTFATFTDTATSTSTFTTGSVDIELAGETDDAYAFTSLQMTNMKPSDVRYATLPVANTGSLPFSYAMTSAESEAVLSAGLTLGAVIGAATCDATGYTAAALTPANVIVAGGPLASAAIASRPLAAGAAETLCVRVELPTDAGNALQGLTTTSTFTFIATQS